MNLGVVAVVHGGPCRGVILGRQQVLQLAGTFGPSGFVGVEVEAPLDTAPAGVALEGLALFRSGRGFRSICCRVSMATRSASNFATAPTREPAGTGEARPQDARCGLDCASRARELARATTAGSGVSIRDASMHSARAASTEGTTMGVASSGRIGGSSGSNPGSHREGAVERRAMGVLQEKWGTHRSRGEACSPVGWQVLVHDRCFGHGQAKAASDFRVKFTGVGKVDVPGFKEPVERTSAGVGLSPV